MFFFFVAVFFSQSLIETEKHADLGPVGLGRRLCCLLEGYGNWAHFPFGRGVSEVSMMQLEDTWFLWPTVIIWPSHSPWYKYPPCACSYRSLFQIILTRYLFVSKLSSPDILYLYRLRDYGTFRVTIMAVSSKFGCTHLYSSVWSLTKWSFKYQIHFFIVSRKKHFFYG